MKVDFHLHSTASDGTCTPGETALLTSAFSAAALTDHDNVDGIEEFLLKSEGRGVAGIELSIEPGEGFDRFHLLALGIDPRNERLLGFLERIRVSREERNERITANFHRLGIPVRPAPSGGVLARPHYARWLVDNGFAGSIQEAFAVYLLADSPRATRCYESRVRPSQEEAFDVVHAAGGLCIMAHPKFWRNSWRAEGCDFSVAERGLGALREKGLDGVEAIYSANTPADNVAFTMIAERLSLLKSAGSDFHGTNKPGQTVGVDVDEGFIMPLLETLGMA